VTVEAIDGYDLDWTINTTKGPVNEVASFARRESQGRAAAYWPVYDPWWWGAYPWGIGGWWGYPGVGLYYPGYYYGGGHFRGGHRGGFHGGGGHHR